MGIGKTLYSEEAYALRGWLKNQRKQKKLTMRDVAHAIDRPSSFVAKLESGDRKLEVVEYALYCRYLHADPFEGIAIIQRIITVGVNPPIPAPAKDVGGRR